MTSNDSEKTPTIRVPWTRLEEPMEEAMPFQVEREGVPVPRIVPQSEYGVSDADEGAERGVEDAPQPPAIEVPQWLLDNCVTTTEEWNDHPEFLRLLDVIPLNKADNSRDELETGSNPEPAVEVYEMESTLFNPLLGLVRRDAPSEEDLSSQSIASNGVRFTKDIIRLQAPMPAASESMAKFTRNVVKHFARTIDSDLITLTRDDLEDLGDHYAPPDASDSSSTTSDSSSDSDDDETMGNYLDILLNREPWSPPPPPMTLCRRCSSLPPVVLRVPEEDVSPCDGYESEAEEPKKKKLIPFRAILNAPCVKKASDSRAMPLIVHLFISEGDLTRSLFRGLQAAIRDYPVRHGILLIVTTESPPQSTTYIQGQHRGPGGSLPLPFTAPTEVLPVRAAAQEALLKANGRCELRARNIRDIKRYIRREESPGCDSSLLAPYADWSFVDGSAIAERLGRASLFEIGLEAISRSVGQPVKDDNIRKAVLDCGVLSKSLNAWNDFGAPLPPRAPMPMPRPPRGGRPPVRVGGPPPPPPFPVPPPRAALDPRNDVEPLQDLDDEWTKFPPAVQKVMRQITYMQGPPFTYSKYSWERKFSHCLIAPKDVEVGWDDIALEPEVEGAIRGLLRQHSDAAGSGTSYGLLQRSRVGGALLYGPAGTGKTHLARVLARESGSTVISVCLADISDNDFDVRLLIRGLFSLGTLLAPSILFFDEADLCMGVREKAFNQVQISQILTEMNRLGAVKNSPLVLLASNAPAELDQAVLRRIPNRIHMGLPSAEMRAEIFEVSLRGEILHPDLDYQLLALMTPRFSGADIHHLCVQVTIACDTFVEDGADRGKRLLTQALFEKVLKKAKPSVSKASLASLRKFAKEFDPAAVETMEPLETEEFMEQEDMFVDVPVFK